MDDTRNDIRFLLGWEPVTLAGFDPNRTLLQYLREDVRLRGTKEGCAEGDCGACTVVVGEIVGDEMRYQPVNACIAFLAAMDGKQVLTVEHVANGTLHPIQQALVDHDASQCGFCTPGFVMSLLALHLTGGPTDRTTIDDALAGNLCRCTGYGPIIAAAQDACGLAPSADWVERRAAAEATLRDWAADDRTVEIDGAAGHYIAPRTPEQLGDILAAHDDAVMVAGATDVGLWVTKQGRRLSPLVDVNTVAALHAVEASETHIEIGAAATYSEAEAALGTVSPSLAALLRRLGALQVRSRGTVGGNIANGSPIGDMPPPLIALDAMLVLGSRDGEREIPLDAFFIDYGKQDLRPGEFVAAIRVPRPTDGVFRCYKISKRFDQDITAVLGAFNVTVEDGDVARARVCYGGMAATPKRAEACEAALQGNAWDAATVERAKAALASDFTPISDMRASADYRLHVAGNLLDRFFLDVTEPAVPIELADHTALGAVGHA